MNIRIRRFMPVVALAVVLLPSPARANGLISWLDKLSGPGPWLGFNVDLCIRTFGENPPRPEQPEREGEARVLGLLVSCPESRLMVQHFSWYATIGVGFALDNDLDYTGQDVTGKSARASYVRVGSSLMYTAHPSVDLGVGGGVMAFRGPRFDGFSRVYVQPAKLGVRPLLLRNRAGLSEPEIEARGWLLLTADWMILLGTLEGADFGAPADPLRVRNEIVPQFGVTIDIPRLLRALRAERRQ